jgi:hypothetical protein
MNNIYKSPNGYYYKEVNGNKTRVEAPFKELLRGTLKEISKYVQQAVIIDGSPDREICGILEKLDNGRWICYRTNKGSIEAGRPMCMIKQNAKYIWHTHPRNSKIYPSKEDIIALLRRSAKKSLIFTLYGFWVIEKNEPKNYIIEKGDYYHKLMARLEKENSKLYHSRVTNHGKEYNESVFKKYSEGVNRAMDHKVSIKFYGH